MFYILKYTLKSFLSYLSALTVSLIITPYAWAWEVLHSYESLELDPQKHLVLWDLDHTLIEPSTYEGSEPWFQYLLHTARNVLPSEDIVALYCRSQEHIILRLTDPVLAEKWLQWNGAVPMIGLTSRSYSLASLTHGHLNRLGIPFQHSFFEASLFPSVASQGILFTSGGVKRDFVKQLMEQNPEYRQRTVIFIDDSSHHLDLVEKYLNQEGIACKIYLYSASREKYETAKLVPF